MAKIVSKDEIIILISLIAFAFFWVLLVIPYLTTNAIFLNQNPIVQYIFFNIGFIILTIIIFGFPFSIFAKNKIKISTLFLSGIGSWLGFSFIIDMWQPPFYLSPSGQVLIQNAQALPLTSVDAMMAFVWQNLGISVNLLFFFTYIITPIIAGIIMVILFAPKKVMKFVGLNH